MCSLPPEPWCHQGPTAEGKTLPAAPSGRLIIAIRVGLFYSLLISRKLCKSFAGGWAEEVWVFEQDLSQRKNSRWFPELAPNVSGVRSATSDCLRRAGGPILRRVSQGRQLWELAVCSDWADAWVFASDTIVKLGATSNKPPAMIKSRSRSCFVPLLLTTESYSCDVALSRSFGTINQELTSGLGTEPWQYARSVRALSLG